MQKLQVLVGLPSLKDSIGHEKVSELVHTNLFVHSIFFSISFCRFFFVLDTGIPDCLAITVHELNGISSIKFHFFGYGRK